MHDTNDKSINIERYYVNSKALNEDYNQIYMYTDLFITYSGTAICPVKIELMILNNEEKTMISDIRCVLSGKQTKITLEAELTDMQMWSSEIPRCYSFLIIIKDEEGTKLYDKRFKHGFRFIETKDNNLYINGKQIYLNGVIYNNYEENDIDTLRSKYLEDIIILKRNNINAVMTYDYDNANIFYEMCDEYGIYVINKPISITDDEDQIICNEEVIKEIIYKYINHPSVIIWNIDGRVDIPIKLYKQMMSFDNTRPIYYEGNSGLKNYNPLIFTYDFIKQNEREEEIDNDHPIVGNFLCDYLIRKEEIQNTINKGIVYDNRQLTPFSYEIKKQYESIKIYPKDIIKGVFSIKNCSDTFELFNYNFTWEIIEDGIVIKSGVLSAITVPINSRKDIYIEYNMKDILENASYHININMVTKEESWWSKKGYNVAFAQFVIPYKAHKKKKAKNMIPAKLRDRKLKYEIIGDNFEIIVDKLKGNIRSIEFDRKQYILAPVIVYVETQDERIQMSKVKDIKINHMNEDIINIEVIRKCTQIKGYIITNYEIKSDGKVNIINRIRSSNEHIKIGMLIEIPDRFNDFSWFGKGPNDTYSEYNDGSKVGLYYYNLNNYVKSGNKSDVRWSAFTDTDGEGLLVESCKDILLNVHPQIHESYSINQDNYNEKPIIIDVKCSSKSSYNFNTSSQDEDLYAFSIRRVI